ncbi:YbaN family protein, partial [Flavobacteriaceae bacterium]|nr:YbaN family protein [Flavobacteriaceae bacterium]
MKKSLWIALGFFFVSCAYIEIILPGVPTTLFVILAAYAFGKLSEKFGIQITLQHILNFIGSVKDFLRCILFIKPGIKELCGIKNKDLIVLGNGPSLTAELTKDLVFFKEKDTMCCNEFVNSDYYVVIQPKYYVFLDPAYWRKTDVKKVNEEMAQTLKNLNEKTTWPLTIIMRVAGKDWNFFMDLPKLNKNINIVYFYNNGIVAP